MNNVKIRGCDYLEKDPISGAVLLSENQGVADIKLNNLMKRLGKVEQQNTRIILTLEKICKHFGIDIEDNNT